MNHRVVHKRLQEMTENLAILEEFKSLSFAQFAADPKIYKLAERCFQLCIECIIDIAHYLISQRKWEQPLDNTEAILILGANGVLDEFFSQSIAGMAGFRNILVHGYLSIDRTIVYENLRRLEDFHTFQAQVLAYLNQQSSSADEHA